MEFLLEGNPIWQQVTVGLCGGILAGMAGVNLLRHPYIRPAAQRYQKLILQFNLKPVDVIFLSFCAGFGEEILFRGAIQSYLGIWPTAIGFVAIHGYLNPRNLRISIYGSFMTLAIAGIGYLCVYFGIWSAIAAHFAIDIVLFMSVLGRKQESV